jgi:hypothetical protein
MLARAPLYLLVATHLVAWFSGRNSAPVPLDAVEIEGECLESLGKCTVARDLAASGYSFFWLFGLSVGVVFVACSVIYVSCALQLDWCWPRTAASLITHSPPRRAVKSRLAEIQ